ncbi:cytochrome o ubiquinol oxidase subunit IV [Pectobacteriaceae bacterium CE70]|uniref:Cytochrome bo(3) ubiquinol oxidase subunit 4 n=1 Tax=Serratia sp. (strain ATCC 39006) TaxID=104623 RepID=A0A2I5TAX1_SERS3|nr:cytochrome o ubiquinol oxidase subunit IV [Serratia sp. ATCC 39006]WJV63664.1 cytochrome o ubiquinol oxidase subunit IV [Pectobacteriaceae bacterium C52]WJV68056.1 cytochrome o ubiquinol oxidase subunit IV [Pectobacteriaceae bacterium CE70]WJY11997.1 cytochrome o ubiquinol oxidase subunit IV [Pectobacteriaceae bacterium C80]AUH01706.1 cytochrome o ubiquinol oxidase subunit IV [Serratia sp. ATCC 39006]AUH06029.1 cytochrome o ubiquinol oxidase subunit IV [Serratia sp. ATCC 39006]
MSHSTYDHAGASHGSVKSYLIGFILSIILTVIPFSMVMTGSASNSTVILTVVGCAIIQILVHLVYFLHLNTSSEGRWNVVALVFTVLIIGIVVTGSIWIMWSTHYNMMLQ